MKKPDKKIIYALLFVVAAGAAIWLYSAVKQTEVSVAVDEGIDVTPEVIESIEAIGQWEFLAIDDEELVDTLRKGFFSDDKLARIYYGTLRIGIDTRQLERGWLQADGDSIMVTLPDVTLLDRHFIDEARTKSFYESGRWSAEVREALYKKAYRQMLRNSMTPKNLDAARKNGEAQILRLLRTLGLQRVRIIWQPSSTASGVPA